MKREVDLVSYLPPFLQEYKEQKSALTAENSEFSLFWNAANRLLYNEFIETADEFGISCFERQLGILPFKEDNLNIRKARVKAKWSNSIPYTTKALYEYLKNLVSSEDFNIEKLYEIYRLKVQIFNHNKYDEILLIIRDFINQIVPSNVVLDFSAVDTTRVNSNVYLGCAQTAFIRIIAKPESSSVTKVEKLNMKLGLPIIKYVKIQVG